MHIVHRSFHPIRVLIANFLQTSAAVVALACGLTPVAMAQVGTAFTYQGVLKNGTSLYSGNADFIFSLFDDVGGDFQIGADVPINNVAVAQGVFTTSVDFGTLAFDGNARWLEIEVRTPAGSANPFVMLTPRQRISATPYAQFALNVANPSPFTLSGSNAVFTGGNVGIGTSSPTQPLQVTNGLFATLLLDRTGGSQMQASAQGTTALVGTANNFPFRITTNNQVRMSFDTSGNVGIGTTTPDGKLDVRQANAADIFNLYDGGTNVFSVIDGGNVGIGSNNPTQRLQVAGNIKASGWIGSDAIHPVDIFVNNQRAVRFEAASTSIPSAFGPVPNIVGGYSGNLVSPTEIDSTPLVAGAFIGGGGFDLNVNRVTDHFGVIGGGAKNLVGRNAANTQNSWFATVAGGYGNTAREYASMVGGGYENRAQDEYSFAGGGQSNTANKKWSAVVGGFGNLADDMYAIVGGGESNTASGMHSTIPGGRDNRAFGQYSFAAGRRAKADHIGTFVWADQGGAAGADFTSTAGNQFLVRAAGGVGINTNAPAAVLHVAGDAIFNSGLKPGNTASSMTIASTSINAPATFSILAGSSMGINGSSTVDVTADGNLTVDSATTLRLEGTTVNVVSNANAAISASGTLTVSATQVAISGIQTLGIGGSSGGFMLGVNGSAAKPGGGSWTALSDARLKKNVQPLHGSLDRLLALRGVSFEYRDPAMPLCDDQPHEGFIAQEVQRVFPQWVDDNADGYKTLSISGFEALTVEALRELREEKDREIERLQAENDALSLRLEAIERAVQDLVNRR